MAKSEKDKECQAIKTPKSPEEFGASFEAAARFWDPSQSVEYETSPDIEEEIKKFEQGFSYKFHPNWVNVNCWLPDQIDPHSYVHLSHFWVYDGDEVFLAQWLQIDCLRKDEKELYLKTKGKWFGYVDGTECRSAHPNISHWLPITIPAAPTGDE